MASQAIFGQMALGSETNTVVATVPDGVEFATVNIGMVNRAESELTESATVRVALINGTNVSSITNASYREYGAVLDPGGKLEWFGVVVPAGWSVVCWADKNSVSAYTHGIAQI
jgi:hypothetical protein